MTFARPPLPLGADMRDLRSPNRRLRSARIRAGFLSGAAAAKAFGWPVGTYGGHENGHRGITFEVAGRYARAFSVSALWLLTGSAEATITAGPARLTAKPTVVKHPVVVSVPYEQAGDLPDPEYIEMLEVEPAAGRGSIIEDAPVIGRVAFRRDWLKQHGLLARQCVLIRVRGESMQPTLPDQCNILVALHRQRRRAGAIFVVRTDDGLVVKRASKNSGRWQLVSDHPAYSPMEWTDNDQLIGEVVWMARTFTPGRSQNPVSNRRRVS